MPKQKKVAIIGNISSFDKCSITTALPIFAASGGIETYPLLTAIVASRDNDIDSPDYCDLTNNMPTVAEYWRSQQLKLDGLISGFLGSPEQANVVSDILTHCKAQDSLASVDPIMGDHGQMYGSSSPKMVDAMRNLCKHADIIVPNITEACLMLDEPYQPGPYTREYIQDLLVRLSQLGPSMVVISGVWFSKFLSGAAGYDTVDGSFTYAFSKHIKGEYKGVGDVFDSVLLSALLHNMKFRNALQFAVDFTHKSILTQTNAEKKNIDMFQYGIDFEMNLPWIIKTFKSDRT